jgi:hypothetical protein
MNWDAISAVGEIIGATAVVISLVYLAMQIRSQNKQSRIAAKHHMARELREVTAVFATEDMTDIFVRANKSYEDITDAESVRFILLITNMFRAWEGAFFENRIGYLDAHLWEALSRDFHQSIGAPSIQYVWGLRKGNYDVDFIDYVDGLIGDLDVHEYLLR